MLTLLIGRAATGKSRYCSECFAARAVKRTLSSTEQCYYVVPEQYMLAAERRILELPEMEGRALLGAEVISFRRLAHRILKKFGGGTGAALDNVGRSMLLTRALTLVANELDYYSSAGSDMAVTAGIFKLFGELETYNAQVSEIPGKLRKLSAGSEGTSSVKFSDLARIYEKYAELRAPFGRSESELIMEAAALAEEHGYFSGAYIWIDEFTGFTGQELTLMEPMLRQAESVTLALCNSGRHEPVFRALDNTLEAVKALAVSARCGFTVIDLNDVLSELPPGSGSAGVKQDRLTRESRFMREFEQAYTALVPGKVRLSPEGILDIAGCKNGYCEVLRAAEQILKLRRAGMRFSDIAVAARDLNTYEAYIEVVFSGAGIPYFLDNTRTVRSNPAVMALLTLPSLFIRDMRARDVRELVKSGLFFSGDRADRLDNQILKERLSGSRRYLADSASPDVKLLGRLYTELKDCFTGAGTIAEAAGGFLNILQKHGVDAAAQARGEQLIIAGDADRAQEELRIWDVILKVFDRIREFLGDIPAGDGLKAARILDDLLHSAFSGLEVGLLPQNRDCVTVAGTGRSRLGHRKALILLGVNEGVMPAEITDSGTLTGSERGSVLDSGELKLADDSISRAYKELFMVYSAIFSPTEFLSISFAYTDGANGEMQPSSAVIGRLKRIFGGSIVKSWEPEQKYAVTEDKYGDRGVPEESAADGCAPADPEDGTIPPELSKKLFIRSDPPVFSASKLEDYADCPFRFLLADGLKLEPRDEGEIRSSDIGDIVHKVLEVGTLRLTGSLSGAGEGTDSSDLAGRVSEAVDSVFDATVAETFPYPERFTHTELLLIERLRAFCKRSLHSMLDQLSRSLFRPIAFECTFGNKPGSLLPALYVKGGGELPDSVLIQGKIDRLDGFVSDGDCYVRVVDYKSSEKNMKLSDIVSGKKIQLLTYMLAVLDSKAAGDRFRELCGAPALGSPAENSVRADSDGSAPGSSDGSAPANKPGAGLYFVFGDGRVKAVSPSDAAIEKASKDRFAMTGFIVDDSEVLRGLCGSLSSTGEPNEAGYRIPQNLRLDAAGFRSLCGELRKGILNTVDNIASGRFSPSPTPDSANNYACRYCEYRPICGLVVKSE